MAATDETNLEAIAGRLRQLRKALGLTQVELCRRLDVQTPTWNNYEKARSRLRLDEALKVVRAFHVTLDWIYLGNPALMPGYLLEKMRQMENAERPDEQRSRKRRA